MYWMIVYQFDHLRAWWRARRWTHAIERAQFPTFWSCRGLLGKPVVYGKMKAAKQAFKRSLAPAETLDMFAVEYRNAVELV